MYERITKAIATIIIAAMIMGIVPAIRAAPPPAPAIWVTPEENFFYVPSTSVGDKFNVTILISTTGPSFTWQARINFNPSQLNAVRAAYTGGSVSQFFAGHGTIPVTPTIDNTAGFVVHGESLVGADSIPAGSASLFWIEFQIMIAPAGDEALTSLISVEDPSLTNTFILDPDLNTITPLNVGSAQYSFSPPPPIRDLAISDLTLSSSNVNQGDNVTITVVVLNNGTVAETVVVEIRFDSTIIGAFNVSLLAVGASQTLVLEWNTTDASFGVHTITAEVQTVPGDIDLTNNAMQKSIVIQNPEGPSTDLNGDGKVNMMDIAIVARAFGTREGDLRWNPVADVNLDGVVNLFDIALVAADFWKH